MDVSESGALADRLDPSMSGSAVEPLAVVADEDRPLSPYTDREVNRARGSWDEWDHCRLVALAEDAQRAMPTVEAEIADIGVACLADSLTRKPLSPRSTANAAR